MIDRDHGWACILQLKFHVGEESCVSDAWMLCLFLAVKDLTSILRAVDCFLPVGAAQVELHVCHATGREANTAYGFVQPEK